MQQKTKKAATKEKNIMEIQFTTKSRKAIKP